MAQQKTTAAAKRKTAKGKSATAAKDGKPKNITIKGRRFDLPAELPYSLIRLSGALPNDPTGEAMVVQEILGEEQMDEVFNLGLTMQEGVDFGRKVMAKYGMTPGESGASARS
jgi:hypothetical protein